MKRFTDNTERRPCGVPAALIGVSPHLKDVRLDDCLVARISPRRLTIWEPLPTKAPGPHLTRPWCCYINTVIFYRHPFITMPPKHWRDCDGTLHPGSVGTFFDWGSVETRLTWDSLVEFEGDIYKTGGGTVRWASHARQAARWWICRWARAEPA